MRTSGQVLERINSTYITVDLIDMSEVQQLGRDCHWQ